MKTIMSCFLMIVTLATAFGDDGLIPTPKIAGGKLQIRGFAQAIADVGNAQANVDFPVLRVKGIYERGSIKIGSEINFAEMDKKDSNWLRELWVDCQLTDRLTARVGRVFLASGFSSPANYALNTVKYPSAVFYSCYGWGAQLCYQTEQWQFLLDVTDGSETSFPDSADRQGFDCSGRLERDFEQGFIGATFEGSRDFWRFGLDAEATPAKSLTLRGLVCYETNADEKTSDRIGLYLFAAYRPEKADWLELHAQADFVDRLAKNYEEYQWAKVENGMTVLKRTELTSDSANDTAITLGARFFGGRDDCLTLTVDCQIPLADEGENRDPKFLGRLQFRF